jgi:hypothetical protein
MKQWLDWRTIDVLTMVGGQGRAFTEILGGQPLRRYPPFV